MNIHRWQATHFGIDNVVLLTFRVFYELIYISIFCEIDQIECNSHCVQKEKNNQQLKESNLSLMKCV